MTKHRSFGLVLLEHHQPPRKSLIYASFGHDGHDTTILGFPCHRFERCKPEYADLWLGRSGSSCHYMATWSKAWPFVVGYDPEKHVIKTVKFRECGQRSKVSKEKIKKPCVVLSVYLFFGKSAPSQYSLEPPLPGFAFKTSLKRTSLKTQNDLDVYPDGFYQTFRKGRKKHQKKNTGHC